MTRPPAPFIVGMGRSGTTLLRMMLDAHPELAIPAETHFAPAVRAYDRGGPDAAVEAIVGNGLWGEYGLSAEEFAQRVEQVRPAGVGEVLRAFYELYAERRGKPRWGDKSPYYVTVMTHLQELLPEARFVHVVRDGRDVALSTIPLWFGPDDVAGVAREWCEKLAAARRQAPALPFYTEIRYEDLVREPAAVLEPICEFLELEWTPALLDYHRDAAQKLAGEIGDLRQNGRVLSAEERRGIHSLIGRPPQLDRIERWRREMSTTDRELFDRVAADTLVTHGYEVG
jgi:Sulfotransferase family